MLSGRRRVPNCRPVFWSDSPTTEPRVYRSIYMARLVQSQNKHVQDHHPLEAK
jgi:hypothetical protein